MMFGLIFSLGLLLLCLLFRLAARLRLAVPLAYALIVPTLFHQWYYAHYALANGIWYAMLVLAALSWVVSLIRWVRRWVTTP